MKKTLINLSLCLLCIAFTYAQKTKFKTGKTSSKNYFTAIKYKDVRGKIIIPVSIQDSTYYFLFDTGAPNVISSNLLNVVKHSSKKNLTVSDSNDRKQRMDLTTLQSITIGDLEFTNTSALVFDGDNNILFDCFEIDGIIGSNLLQKSIVQINSKTQELILTNSIDNLDLKSETPTKLFINNGQGSPYIQIQLKGKNNVSEKLLFDTGASGFYDMSKQHLSLFKEQKVATHVLSSEGSAGIGLFGASEANTTYRLTIPEISINNHVFTNVMTETTDDKNSRIGSDIFKYGVVTLDFRKRHFYFNSFNERANLMEKQLGFTPIVQNNKLIVGVVWDRQLKGKISYGDEIVSINNIKFSNANVCDLIAKESPFKSSDTLEIAFKNKDNKINRFTLKRTFQD
ncbi:hypothetical protein EYD45_02620 [Hyunsoonleella flava]|uniref:Aspartyl protease n=1 Tax=Hyunsoonleella flava TaxID=2527939 RepID=A0A4Q9FLV6_9FLAO|nr:retropepsin-like aspartic protease [Hyunsoonleella flava]TBN06797.1 hypothetical protein EYD45_02620 [Hyunsoonleella flava]